MGSILGVGEEDEMRFPEQLVGERGALVRPVQAGQLTQAEAAAALGRSVRQVRRLVRRLEAAGGALDALGYQRTQPAPNRLPEAVQEAVQAVAAAHPRWRAPAVWEALEAQGLAPLPSVRTVGRWLSTAGPAGGAGARGPPGGSKRPGRWTWSRWTPPTGSGWSAPGTPT